MWIFSFKSSANFVMPLPSMDALLFLKGLEIMLFIVSCTVDTKVISSWLRIKHICRQIYVGLLHSVVCNLMLEIKREGFNCFCFQIRKALNPYAYKILQYAGFPWPLVYI